MFAEAEQARYTIHIFDENEFKFYLDFKEFSSKSVCRRNSIVDTFDLIHAQKVEQHKRLWTGLDGSTRNCFRRTKVNQRIS